MKRLRMLLALGLLASALMAVPGCDSPTAPDPTLKTPEQLAEEARKAAEEARIKAACTQTDVEATFRQGGFGVSRWSSKDDVDVRGLPLNRDGAAVPQNCDPPFSRIAAWTFLVGPGLSCVPFGNVRSLLLAINCEGDGTVVGLLSHVSLGKVFNDETVGLVSSAGVKARAPLRFSEAEIRKLLAAFVARDAEGLREPTPYELAIAARALRGTW